MSEAWKVGDAVRHKSGGPVMVVDRLLPLADGNPILARWWAGSDFHYDRFPADAITRPGLLSLLRVRVWLT